MICSQKSCDLTPPSSFLSNFSTCSLLHYLIIMLLLRPVVAHITIMLWQECNTIEELWKRRLSHTAEVGPCVICGSRDGSTAWSVHCTQRHLWVNQTYSKLYSRQMRPLKHDQMQPVCMCMFLLIGKGQSAQKKTILGRK